MYTRNEIETTRLEPIQFYPEGHVEKKLPDISLF